MALANALGLRESQLRWIVCSGLPPHANLLFFYANRPLSAAFARESPGAKCGRLEPCLATARSSCLTFREPPLQRLGAALSEKASVCPGVAGSRRQGRCRSGRSLIGGADIIAHPDEGEIRHFWRVSAAMAEPFRPRQRRHFWRSLDCTKKSRRIDDLYRAELSLTVQTSTVA
jgi:hypothetical protein